MQILVGHALFQWRNTLQEIICKHTNARQIILIENCTHLSFADDRIEQWWHRVVASTLWGQDKMAVNFQTTFSIAFSWIKLNIFIKILLKFVPKGPIDNITTLVQIKACRRPRDKPSSEPMMVILLKHKCLTRPQWPWCGAQPWDG